MVELVQTNDAGHFDLKALLRMCEESAHSLDGHKLTIEQPGPIVAPGIFGFVLLDGTSPIAFARVLSDDFVCSWIAEFRIHPSWRGNGLGKRLLTEIRERFGHTAVYVQTPSSSAEYFTRNGLLRKAKLVACSVPPGVPDIPRGEWAADTCRISLTCEGVSPTALAKVYDSVGFGIRNASPEEALSRCFGPSVFGHFAYDGDELIGMARAMSDGATVTWLAEICVRPEWQGRGVGCELLQSMCARFSHTWIYAEAFSNQIEFFQHHGLPARADWAACSLGPIR